MLVEWDPFVPDRREQVAFVKGLGADKKQLTGTTPRQTVFDFADLVFSARDSIQGNNKSFNQE